MNFRALHLGDVLASIEAGKSIQTLERAAAPDEPGILKVSAVSWGSFDACAAKAVSRDYAPPESHKVRKGDLLFSRANTIELTGAVAISDGDYPNRYLSDKTLRLVIKPDLALPDFLLLALRSPEARGHIEANAGGTSDSMRNISQSAMLSIPLRLPGLEDQLVISNRVSSALRDSSTALDATQSQIELSGRLLLTITSEAFPVSNPISAGLIRTVRPEPVEGRPASKGSGRASTSSARTDVSEWHWHPLPSLARLESGHTPSRRHPEWWGGEVPWLALPDIRKLHGKRAMQTIENTNALGLANSSARLLPVNTVCVSRTASIGFVTLLDRPMATSQDFCNWICDPEKLDAEFLMYAFMASQDSLRELGSGAVHKTIYMPTIQSFQVCAPALAEQRRIASRLRERMAAAEALQVSLKARLAQIEQLPQRILAAAFDAVRGPTGSPRTGPGGAIAKSVRPELVEGRADFAETPK